MELVAALQFFILLKLAEDVEANRTSILGSVAIAHPCSFTYRVYLSLRQPLRDDSIFLAKLEQLFIGHIISVGLPVRSIGFAFLESPLHQALFFTHAADTGHTCHDRLIECVLFLSLHLLLMHVGNQREFSSLIFACLLTSFLLFHLRFVLCISDLGSQFEVSLS